MAPSTPKPKKSPDVATVAPQRVERVRAVRTGLNEYDVVVDVWEGPPTRTEVQATKVSGVSAQYRCRLFLEEQLGPNRLKGTGL